MYVISQFIIALRYIESFSKKWSQIIRRECYILFSVYRRTIFVRLIGSFEESFIGLLARFHLTVTLTVRNYRVTIINFYTL